MEVTQKNAIPSIFDLPVSIAQSVVTKRKSPRKWTASTVSFVPRRRRSKSPVSLYYQLRFSTPIRFERTQNNFERHSPFLRVFHFLFALIISSLASRPYNIILLTLFSILKQEISLSDHTYHKSSSSTSIKNERHTPIFSFRERLPANNYSAAPDQPGESLRLIRHNNG